MSIITLKNSSMMEELGCLWKTGLSFEESEEEGVSSKKLHLSLWKN